MNTRKATILVTILFALMLSITKVPQLKAKLPNNALERDKYFINVRFYEDNLTISGFLVLTHKNNYSITFRNIYFHIYPNAFKTKGGYISIISVKDNIGPLSYTITGTDNTILNVTLREPLGSGELLKLNITFRVKVPVLQDRFGYWKGVLALGNWYPILAVYDEERGWHLDPYFPHGESFHFYFADYELFIEVDKNFTVAATGILIETKELDNGRILMHWKAKNVREIALAGSKRYKVSSAKLWDITIYSYYLSEHKPLGMYALEVARRALKVFSEHFGKYPYPALRVCETYGWYGGMEYPMVIFITERLYRRYGLRSALEIVVAHETAHQWWYATLANDEANEPWLDEAFAEYSQVLYCEWVYGKSKARSVFNSWIRNPYLSYLKRYKDLPANMSVWDYETPTEYYNTIYNKGAYILHMLRQVMGYDKFFKLLKIWYSNYKFKFARIRDFIKTAEEVYGKDLSWFFNAWLFSSGIPRYVILSAEARPTLAGHVIKVTIVQVEPKGKVIPAYIPVVVSTLEKEYTFYVLVNGTGELSGVVISGIPKWVVLDPYNDVLRLSQEKTYVTFNITSEETESMIPYITLTAIYAFLGLSLTKIVKRPR